MIDRKEQILDITAELLLSHSFSSFSYQDLSDRLGITKASIHYHFPTKEALGEAVAEWLRHQLMEQLEGVSQKSASPWARFDGFVAVIGDFMQSGNKICPPGILHAEHNVIPEGMKRAAQALRRGLVDWLAEVLADGRDQGVMHFPGTPHDQAVCIQAALQGALQVARADGPKEFTTVVHQLQKGMKVAA